MNTAESQTARPAVERAVTKYPPDQGNEVKSENNDVSESSQSDEKPEPIIDAEPTEEWVQGFKLFMIISGLIFGTFLMLLDTSIIATAIPRITTDFHALEDVGWYGASYQLASAALQPLTGKFYTHFGGKWTFLAFFAVFELGSLLCGVANSSNMLIAGRAIAGMGASGIQNGAFTIVAQSVPLHKGPPLMGLVLGISQLGLVMGPLIGGALTEYTTWRWFLLVFVKLPGTVKVPSWRTVVTDLDLLGFTLFAPAMIQLLLALQYGGNRHAWDSATVIGLFCGAAGTFAIFLWWEYRKGDEAMIPFSIIGKRVVYSAFPKVGYFTPFAIVGGALCAIASGLLSTFDVSISTGKWVGYQILLGAGEGMALQMPVIAVQNCITPAQIPTAMALVMFSSTLVPSSDLPGVLVAYSKSIDRVFYLCAGASAGVFFASFGMGWKNIKPKKEVAEVDV
ncbi:putative HC-toxin efflux carrier TOXA [Glarea lozoyensis 74030]|uniref:Putative HC-toxin efflux carrier TOXA n=1 Tax=Glarea lozoyensis (strain ATCC 74030 / MF5533) TaxID=1104152 RepID=H0ESF2_GLAL7|nr:putative HC-toxin efflux carrier TOXA [Glarea lozoyensis 74030]